MKKFLAVVLTILALSASCGGGSRTASTVATATPTAQPGGCPVDSAICEFARVAEGALQRGDPWALITPESRHYQEVQSGDGVVTGIGAAILRQLSRGGSEPPRVAGIACPLEGLKPSCVESFGLVFSSLAGGQVAGTPAFGLAMVGFARSPQAPVMLGLSLPSNPDAALHGGYAGTCGVTTASATPGCLVYPYPGTPPPDLALGRDAKAATVGPDVELPPGVAFVVLNCPSHGGGGCFSVWRYWRKSDGTVERSVLLDSQVLGANLTGVVGTPDGSALYASACRGEGCRVEVDPKSATTEFLRSTDGGITWTTIGSRTGSWWARGTVGHDVLAANFEGFETTYAREPSGRTLVRPPGAARGSPPLDLAGNAVWAASGRPVLLAPDGRDEHGVPLRVPADRGLTLSGYWRQQSRPPVYALDLQLTSDFRTHVARYIAIGGGFASSPNIDFLLRLDRDRNFEPVTWRPTFRLEELLGNASSERVVACLGTDNAIPGSWPALLDPGTGVISTISDFLCLGGNVRAVAAYELGAMVKTPGDCLNLRDAPTATAKQLACLSDGVFVSFVAGSGPADAWPHVRTPGGVEGYVAGEFLTLP